MDHSVIMIDVKIVNSVNSIFIEDRESLLKSKHVNTLCYKYYYVNQKHRSFQLMFKKSAKIRQVQKIKRFVCTT